MSPPGWSLVGAIVLAVVSGWWTRAEAALARAPTAAVRGTKPGSAAARRLQAVLADLPRYLAVLSLVRIVCGTAATVLLTLAFAQWFGVNWRAFLLAVAATAAVTYAVGGVGPYPLARKRGERMALVAATVLHRLAAILGPIPRLLIAPHEMLSAGREGTLAAQEELRGLVDFLSQRTVIEPGEREMVRSVFELGDTIVREVMVPRTDIVFIERDKTLSQALSLALRSGFSRIPVVGENEDDVVGIAYLKDIVSWSHEHPGRDTDTTVAQVMRAATFVPDSKPIDELLREMQARRIHMAIVIDEYGGTAGLVTIEDILEEIVGEITDEYDKERPPVEWLSPEVARVTARLPVAELAELFDIRIEDDDVETVGGLLAHALGRVPIAGSVATVGGLQLTAENLSGRRNLISTVLVRRVDGQARDVPDGAPSPP